MRPIARRTPNRFETGPGRAACHRPLHTLRVTAAALALMCARLASQEAAAQEAAAAPERSGWPDPEMPWDELVADLKANASLALGVSAAYTPSYMGSGSQQLRPRPLWAFQYGRLRISTGGAAAVLGIAQDPRGPGASAELFSSERFRTGVALRIDRGRNSSDVEGLEGLPDIAATLRGRVYASYAMTPRWALAGSFSQDLLGRGGGALASADLGYRAPITPRAEWYFGTSLSWADMRYLRSRYGVPSDSPSGLPAFTPGAGPNSASVGTGFTAAMSSHWVLFGGASATRLLGYAEDSPVTDKGVAASVSIGLAYRWGMRYGGVLPVPRVAPAPSVPGEAQ